MEKRQASSFYQHFDESERPTVDYFVGLFNQFLFKNESILTDFLNPREQYIFQEIVGGYAQLYSFGGYPNAEKRECCFVIGIRDTNKLILRSHF